MHVVLVKMHVVPGVSKDACDVIKRDTCKQMCYSKMYGPNIHGADGLVKGHMVSDVLVKKSVVQDVL